MHRIEAIDATVVSAGQANYSAVSSEAANIQTSSWQKIVVRSLAFLLLFGMPVLGAAQTSNIKTVWIILMENHNWSQIHGSRYAPYINSLLPVASHAEQYFNPPGIHPSLPNYLWLEAGTNFGILDDNPPSINQQSTTQHLVTFLQNKGISWKAYEEDISGTDCPLVDVNKYAVKHDPFVYFDDVTNNLDPNSANCIGHVRPFTELATDLANNTVAQYNFITPNLCDDMHDRCKPINNAIKQGDTWLSQNLPAILNSTAYKNGGAVFITWDEAATGDGPIGMIVLSQFAKGNGYQNSIHYTHGSTLRTFQEIFNATPLLGDAANETDLSDLFAVFP
jgi:phosphatidylinositol-3-phosphatase